MIYYSTMPMPAGTALKSWTDAKLLYFHFNSANGGFASLPMRRVEHIFKQPFRGIPGTYHSISEKRDTWWHVPGFQCVACAKVFFSPDRDGLKHECMKNGGIISDSASMGA